MGLYIAREIGRALKYSDYDIRVVLFEINPEFRADYEAEVIKRYDDYRFIQQEYEEATFVAFVK